MHNLNPSDFAIDPQRGFLPAHDPLTQLPGYFSAWDALGANLPALLLAGRARQHIEHLPELDVQKLCGDGERERGMLLLCIFANAYVWCEAPPAQRLPRCVAVPLWQLATSLGRKPIIHYASNALNNWRRINPDGDIALDNLAMIQGFLTSSDEAWFYLVSVAVEACGAPAIGELVGAQRAAESNQADGLAACLAKVAQCAERMTSALMRMYEKCDPHIFYHRVRPFVASWPEPGIVYEGVSDVPARFAGGSAGQSSLIQVFDAALGVRHTSAESSPFLVAMRAYMPPPHRDFIQALERGPDVHAFVVSQKHDSPQLVERYNLCINLLNGFRLKHMEMAVRYITLQGADKNDDRGTGGTSLSTFLGAVKRETRSHRI